MQKNKKVVIVFVLCLFCIYIVNYFVNSSKNMDTLKSTKNHLNFNNSLALMFETAADSGEYIQSDDTLWPAGDYVYNETLSKCEKGSKLSYEQSTKKVLVEANVSDKCYVYFDIKPKPLFADYIKGLYSTNGINNLYLHKSNLANSAGDNSIRYSGSSETTNNFVCFGSDSEKCENDNLYRIIGVFDDQVKLIKYDYANSNMLGIDGDYNAETTSKSIENLYKGKHEQINLYYFNYKAFNSANYTWETSLLNKTNLNTNFINYLNKQNPKWKNMISDTFWNIGGRSTSDSTPKEFYTGENAAQTNESTKIGLMCVSDYAYATIPSNWNKILSEYATTQNNNWIHMGIAEWTITPSFVAISTAFYVSKDGRINSIQASTTYSIRPVFYLNSSVLYNSGDGTQSSPYRIS